MMYRISNTDDLFAFHITHHESEMCLHHHLRQFYILKYRNLLFTLVSSTILQYCTLFFKREKPPKRHAMPLEIKCSSQDASLPRILASLLPDILNTIVP